MHYWPVVSWARQHSSSSSPPPLRGKPGCETRSWCIILLHFPTHDNLTAYHCTIILLLWYRWSYSLYYCVMSTWRTYLVHTYIHSYRILLTDTVIYSYGWLVWGLFWLALIMMFAIVHWPGWVWPHAWNVMHAWVQTGTTIVIDFCLQCLIKLLSKNEWVVLIYNVCCLSCTHYFSHDSSAHNPVNYRCSLHYT